MATSIQIKRGVTAKVSAYVPLEGELVLDLTTRKLYAGDGSTAGGNQIVASRKGVTDATSAPGGEIGEVLSVTGTSTSLTTSTIASLCSMVLTPGDWEVSACITCTSSAGMTSLTAGTNTSNSAISPFPDRLQLITAITAGTQAIPSTRRRYNVSANTTVYLNISAGFSSGTASAQGYLEARRIR